MRFLKLFFNYLFYNAKYSFKYKPFQIFLLKIITNPLLTIIIHK